MYKLSLNLIFSACLLIGSVTGWAAPKVDSTMDKWEAARQQIKLGSKTNLISAEQLLRETLAEMPDNVELQVEYYSLLFRLVFNGDIEFGKLEKQFSKLHPKARESVEPPAMITAIKAFKQPSLISSILNDEEEVPTSERLKLVQAAIAQQPKSKLGWYLLAITYKQEKQYLLALEAAKSGLEIYKDDPDFNYLAGHLYYIFASEKKCMYEERDLLQKAARHLATATAKEQRSIDFIYSLNLLGSIYVRLGLFPLARIVSEKADRFLWSPDGTILHPESLTDILFYQNKNEEIAQLMKKSNEVEAPLFTRKFEPGLSPEIRRSHSHYLRRSLFFAANNKWKRAYQEYIKAFKWPISMQAQWTGQWVHAIYEQKSPRFVKFMRTGKSFFENGLPADADPWTKSVNNYLEDNTNSEENRLVDKSKNLCELAEAHYFTALKLWRQGNLEASRQHLEKAINTKTFGKPEHMWAKMLLESDVFSIDSKKVAEKK